MYAEEPKHTALPDHVNNLHRLLVVSPAMGAFLKAQQLGDAEYYPLDIKDHAGKIASSEYFVAHLLNHVDCIDPEASEVTWANVGSPRQRILFMKKLVIDPSKVPADRKLFFPRYYDKYPLVRRELADALRAQNFTYVDLVPVE